MVRDMIEHMNAMFSEFENHGAMPGNTPIDLQETDDRLIIEADIPGVENDNTHIQIRDNTLHIKAEDREELHEQEKDYIRKERSSRRYARSIPLTTPVKKDSATATYRDGVLHIELEKQELTDGTEIDVE